MNTADQTPQGGDGTASADTLVFLGPWVESTPLFFLTDPTLDPYERAVFGVLWAWIKRQGQHNDSMPDITEIQRLANIRSRERVAQSLTMLRLTRWITLHSRQRDTQGRHRGSSHALNQEPLSLAETLSIDHEYMAFLTDATTHRREKIRNLAKHLTATITDTLARGDDPQRLPTPAEQIECRQQANAAILGTQVDGIFNNGFVQTQVRLTGMDASVDNFQDTPENDPSTLNRHGSKPENTPVRLTGMDVSVDNSPTTDENTHACLTYSDAEKVSPRTICSSSSLLIKNTTTTPPISPPNEYAWPEFWDDNTKALLVLSLEGIADEDCQDWIDELAGQVRARRKTHDPIRNPVVYFKAICNRYLSGAAQLTDYAMQEQQRRLTQARVAAVRAAPTAPVEKPKQLVDKAAQQQHMQSLTQALKGGQVS